jgi:Flp pilus assembly protein TadG
MSRAIRNFTCRIAGRLAAHGRGFARDQRGVSLIEFAMLLPLMLTLFIGAAEISNAVSIDRKVSIAARSVADLTAQVTSITDVDRDNIFAAAKQVAYPFPDTKLKIKLSSVKIDANKVATIAWGDSSGGATKRNKGDIVTSLIPDGIKIANTTVIWGEIEYVYSPIIAGSDKDWFWKLTGDKTLTDQIFMRPRLSDCVQRPEQQVTSCA